MLLLASQALSVGLAPAYREIDYSGKDSVKQDFRIVNEEAENKYITIFSEDDAFVFENLEYTLASSESELRIPYTINLPDGLEPGRNTFEFMVLTSDEKPDDSDMLKTSIALKHKVYVDVPYEGKHMTSNLFFVTEGNSVSFRIPVFNSGDQDIKETFAVITVLGPDNRPIDSIETDRISLDVGESSKLTAVFNDLMLGDYSAEAVAYYDEGSSVLKKDFRIGTPLIEIIGLGINNFRLGTIAKLDMLLQSNWNQRIDDIKASLQIYDSENRQVSDYSPEDFGLDPGQKKSVPTYWDTEGAEIGEYSANSRLEYEGKKTEKLFELSVEENQITLADSLLSGNVIGDAESQNFNRFLVISIAVIFIILGVLVKVVMKMKNKIR